MGGVPGTAKHSRRGEGLRVIEKDLEIVNRLGLHARAAAKLVHETGRWRSQVTLAKDGEEVTSRDEEAVLRVICGLVKLLYPHGGFTDDELVILSQIACSLRTRIAQQQYHIETLTSGSAREFSLKTLRYHLR